MKILLLEHPRRIPPDRCNDIANTPLTSCLLTGYVAGMLERDGHQVEIIEGFMDNLSYPEVEKMITDYHPDLLGVHMVYHWQGNGELFGLIKRLKGCGAVRQVAAYGFYPTFYFKEILDGCPDIDWVVLGEPEETFSELASSLAAGERHPVLTGLARREGGSVTWTRRPLIRDLDSLPFPVRTRGMFKIPEVNIQGSRGCYGACTFCYINPFYGANSLWRGRSPENIVAEIDQIIDRWGCRHFYFVDPNFFGPGERGQRRARQLAGLLKERQIRFGIEGRVNDIHDETIALLVEAGLRHILIGLESGRDESLQRMNKMTTVAQNERALEILRKNGIQPNIGFIMFEPDSDLADIRVNFEFLKRNRLLENLAITANLLYHHQIILMGTPAFKKLAAEGRLQVSEVTYEGKTLYQNQQVAALAEVMRQLTNYLFNRLDPVWSGRAAAPEDALERFRRVNNLLVDSFEETLRALEQGEAGSEPERTAFVKKVQREMEELLAGFPKQVTP